MFLNRIEMFGFKSFADRTVFEFADGITVLLGPNGCGKSNIVDAVKWVLGEQSVLNMRAERMDDVIFSGTQQRKALNVAEVTLVVANEGGLLEMDRTEISIKRRLYRNGESEYSLNGAPVRLRDVRELFFDTGVGKSAYSVMEQGRIDQILSTHPEDRRYIFEEAAGITKFKMRGSEAERKLIRTEENMAQVENILHEVKRRYESLERQTEKTLRYREIKNMIFERDRDLRLLQWRNLLDSKKKKERSFVSRQEKLTEVTAKIAETKSLMERELDAINTMESRLIENQKRLYGMDLEKESGEELIRSNRERRGEIEASLKAARVREQTVLEALGNLSERRRTKEADLEGFRNGLEEIKGNIASCGETMASAESRIEGNRKEASRITGETAVEEKRRDALQNDLRRLTDDIVRDLDSGLKESEFNRSVRRRLEENIETLLGEVTIHLKGRETILRDLHSLRSGHETGEMLEKTVEELAVLHKDLEQVRGLFDQYKSGSPDFLDDFLAPGGIMTRKRELDEKIEASAGRIQKAKEALVVLAEENRQLSERLDEARGRLEELRVAQARIAAQAGAAREALSSLAREEESEEIRLRDVRRSIDEDGARVEGLDQQLVEITEKREELEQSKKRLKKELVSLTAKISDENKTMAGKEKQLKTLIERRGDLELEREKFLLEEQHIDEEIRLLLEDFQDRNSRKLSDYLDLMPAVRTAPGKIREALAEAKVSLRELGQVNLMAPEEFAEVAERHGFLTGQLEDLRKGKDDLSRVTEEIRKESAALFMQTYKTIREHFHDIFRRLFGGGRAELKLVDPENPLSSGVEIYAQPPGKKLENISLLSGGERSFCGIALLFATHLAKPSPFCILDEIDAALDEANIQRFVNLLSEFSKNSQFVVITHNKKTIAGARNLFGVTMQESGVSRLISLRLDGQEQTDEEPVSADH